MLKFREDVTPARVYFSLSSDGFISVTDSRVRDSTRSEHSPSYSSCRADIKGESYRQGPVTIRWPPPFQFCKIVLGPLVDWFLSPLDKTHSTVFVYRNEWFCDAFIFFLVDVLLKAAGDAPIMKKKKWAVDKSKKVAWVVEFIKKYIKCESGESLVSPCFHRFAIDCH